MTFINSGAVSGEWGSLTNVELRNAPAVARKPAHQLPAPLGHSSTQERGRMAPRPALHLDNRLSEAPNAAPFGAAFAHYASKISALWVAFAGYGCRVTDKAQRR